MKRLVTICLALVLAMVAPAASRAQSTVSQPAPLVGSFIDDVATCSTFFGLDINVAMQGSLAGLLAGAERTSGSAVISLNSFLELFRPEDRLTAYRLYTECLARRYPVSQGGAGLLVPSPVPAYPSGQPTAPTVAPLGPDPFDLGILAEGGISIENFMDGAAHGNHIYRLALERACQLTITENRATEVYIYVELQTGGGGRIDATNSSWGTIQRRVGPGQLRILIDPLRDLSGYYRLDLSVSC
ncbi:MAG: hypothetical protein H6842_07115 [Rhodospirillaceae bacterium]|nr:hypothetical protein [Rhodospirillaceae bacterium]